MGVAFVVSVCSFCKRISMLQAGVSSHHEAYKKAGMQATTLAAVAPQERHSIDSNTFIQ